MLSGGDRRQRRGLRYISSVYMHLIRVVNSQNVRIANGKASCFIIVEYIVDRF
jgi:hypothetical protein